MITRHFQNLNASFNHGGKTLRNVSVFYTDIGLIQVKPSISSSSYRQELLLLNERSVSVNSKGHYDVYKGSSHNSHPLMNLDIFRKSMNHSSNLLCMRNNKFAKSYCAVNSVRHYTELSDLRIQMPRAFNNPFAQAISESSGVQFVMDQFIWFQNYSGLPWWATIAVISFTVRVAVLPLGILQQRNIAKLQNLKKDIQQLSNDVQWKLLSKMVSSQLYSREGQYMYRTAVKNEYDKLIAKENCHPLRGHVAGILQLPLWIAITFSLRNMCYMNPRYDEAAYEVFKDLSTGGFAWVSNFVQYDQYFVLPITLGLCNLALIEISAMAMSQKEVRRVQTILQNVSRVIVIGVVPLIAYMPSCVIFYWLTSSVSALLQTLLFLSPRFRRLTNIPHTESELKNPYAHLVRRLGEKISFRRKIND